MSLATSGSGATVYANIFFLPGILIQESFPRYPLPLQSRLGAPSYAFFPDSLLTS